MLKANLLSHKNYEGNDLTKLKSSLLKLELILNSNEFKTAVLNFKSFQFVGYKCLLGIKVRAIQFKEYSNEELYNILMNGHRKVDNDCLMDLKLQLSNENGGSAVGQTDLNNITTTYKTAFDDMNEGKLAAHLTHEWTHTLGFEHSYSKICDKTRDCFSVPYAIGNIIEILLTGKCSYECKYEILNL